MFYFSCEHPLLDYTMRVMHQTSIRDGDDISSFVYMKNSTFYRSSFSDQYNLVSAKVVPSKLRQVSKR